MGFYQSIVIFVIVFGGEFFIPEESGYTPNTDGDFVYPGRAYSWNGDDLYKKLTDGDDDPGPSRHYTIVFNAFVFMQIFNMICSRKINDEINVFEGILKNKIFIIIFFTITIVQCLIVQFTQDIFQVARDGLYWVQWVICIGIGLTVFPINFISKFIPERWFPELGKKKKNPLEDTGSLSFRKNRRNTMMLRMPQLSFK